MRMMTSMTLQWIRALFSLSVILRWYLIAKFTFTWLICWINKKNFTYTTYYSLGRPYMTPTSLTNPTRSTEIWATTKNSVKVVVNCKYFSLSGENNFIPQTCFFSQLSYDQNSQPTGYQKVALPNIWHDPFIIAEPMLFLLK